MKMQNLIDTLESRRMLTAAPLVTDGSFETPALSAGSLSYAPKGSPWTFSATGSGIAADGSPFGNSKSPQGKQAAFVQNAAPTGSSAGQAGVISQSVTRLAAGTKYTITFFEEGRGNDTAHNIPYSKNPIEILLDSQVIVASEVPSSTTSFNLVTAAFIVPAGTTHTLTIKGLGVKGKDATTFVDDVTLTSDATGGASGTVFNDTNGNGKQDGGDAGLAGWIVYVDSNKNGQFDPGEISTKTDSAGDFNLALKSGTYTISVEIRQGYYETAPHALSYTVTVTAGQTTGGELFGVKPILPV